jgi:uncharacterized caspase-like protein
LSNQRQHAKIMNPRVWLLYFLLALPGSTAAAAEASAEAPRVLQPESKIALVIGNAHYTGALPLKNPGNDATDMCAALRKLGFEVICKLDVPTKREFKDAIFEFTGKINQRSVALFYFAGHGMQVDGINYLLPTKAELRTRSDIEDENIQINYLMSELEARQAALNIFFLDACRNNPLTDPIRGYMPTMGLASQLYAPRNSIIAMSTGAGQLSLDGDGRNGTFTKNLLQHIGAPHQSIEDTLKAVSSGTRADAGRFKRQQDPQITVSFTEQFCMAGCLDAAAAARPNEALLKAQTAQLDKIEATLTETKAKQAELDAQQALLLKKRAELDALRQGLDKVESKQEELARRHAEVTQRERELAKLSADVKASTDKFNELENVRLGLLKKQAEVDRMQKSLAQQQASIAASEEELATRAVKPPEKKKEPPAPVVPVF